VSKILNVMRCRRQGQGIEVGYQSIAVTRSPHRYNTNSILREELSTGRVFGVAVTEFMDNCRVIGKDEVRVSAARKHDSHIAASCCAAQQLYNGPTDPNM